MFSEGRFRRNDSVAQQAPVHVERDARAGFTDPDEKAEKSDVQHIDSTQGEPGEGIISQEVEAFEWREVRRGENLLMAIRSTLMSSTKGFTDIQMWLTATAYAGLIISLYSFSLFL
jgi:hypothetical protein